MGRTVREAFEIGREAVAASPHVDAARGLAEVTPSYPLLRTLPTVNCPSSSFKLWRICQAMPAPPFLLFLVALTRRYVCVFLKISFLNSTVFYCMFVLRRLRLQTLHGRRAQAGKFLLLPAPEGPLVSCHDVPVFVA